MPEIPLNSLAETSLGLPHGLFRVMVQSAVALPLAVQVVHTLPVGALSLSHSLSNSAHISQLITFYHHPSRYVSVANDVSGVIRKISNTCSQFPGIRGIEASCRKKVTLFRVFLVCMSRQPLFHSKSVPHQSVIYSKRKMTYVTKPRISSLV